MGDEKTIEEIVDLLDNFSKSETSRMKVKVSEELPDGTLIREYHHGRCDIKSPFAKGTSFDVLEDKR